MGKIIKKLKSSQIALNILRRLLYIFVKILFATYRLKKEGDINLKEGVFFAWHESILASATLFYKSGISMHSIVSPSKDGKFVGEMAKMFNFRVLYGSAHKQTVSLIRNSLKILKKEKRIFLIGDGSRGPAKKLQPGVKYLAEKSNLPIFFISCRASHKLILKKSWDKFQIPLPFSKIQIKIEEYKADVRASKTPSGIQQSSHLQSPR